MNVLLRRAQRATRKAEASFADRDLAIKAAAEENSYSEIAVATGLSKPRIQQIVRGRKPR